MSTGASIDIEPRVLDIKPRVPAIKPPLDRRRTAAVRYL